MGLADYIAKRIADVNDPMQCSDGKQMTCCYCFGYYDSHSSECVWVLARTLHKLPTETNPREPNWAK